MAYCTSRHPRARSTTSSIRSRRQGRCTWHTQRARTRDGQRGAVLSRVDVESVRRSAYSSAARELLGQRESGRAARCVQRGQALCPSDHDGVSPRSQDGYAHRSNYQYVRVAPASACWTRGVELCCAGVERCADHDLWRWLTDAQFLLCRRRSRGVIPTVHVRRQPADQHRQPDRTTVTQLAELVVELTGTKAPIVYRELPEVDPKVRQPDISKARTELDWSPTVELREGL